MQAIGKYLCGNLKSLGIWWCRVVLKHKVSGRQTYITCRHIKSIIDVPQLLVPQVTVKTEWMEYKVCLASLLLTVVSSLRERVLLVPGRCR